MSEGKVKLHSHLHLSKKPLSVAQYYKDIIKIKLILDDQLSIPLLFCKIGQDRLYKRLKDDVNTLPQNTGVSKIIPPVVENWKLKVVISIVLLITGNTYSPSTSQSTACGHGLLTFFWKVKSAENAMANAMALFDISD